MCRVAVALGWLLAGAAFATADDEPGGDVVRALQARFERIARDARGSVACILVSRSDAYAAAPSWGVAAKGAEPGQLGRFDAAAARRRVPADAPNRGRLLRQIGEHDLSRPDAVPESYGSGIVLDRSGLVLTNAHVVRDATRLYVRLPDARGSWADVHASDPRSDLAVLRLLDPPADLAPLPLGDAGKVRTGQFVLSIANAYAPGFRRSDEPTVGYGLVSNLRRRLPGNTSEMERSKVTLHHYGTLIQTDARTTPGCSGGALLDLDGKVIGLTTALAGIRGDRPGGFAIPIDENTRRLVDVLRRGEEVEYGFLGVVLQPAGGLGGVRVYRVSPGSPAGRAGLLPGDQIVAINDHPIRSNDDLFLYVGMALAGSTARVEVVRGPGVRQTVPVKLSKYYVEGPVLASRRPPARFGLRVDYTSLLSQRNPFPVWGRGVADGVIVREVVPGSPADDARMQPDKVITAVNGRMVNTPAEYYREVARSGARVELTFLTSDGRPELLTLEEK
ncbi:MAG: trypsin-like peptidase domain-containing protein [Gemmataceae bacterium]